MTKQELRALAEKATGHHDVSLAPDVVLALLDENEEKHATLVRAAATMNALIDENAVLRAGLADIANDWTPSALDLKRKARAALAAAGDEGEK